MHSLLRLKTFLIVAALSIGTTLSATDVWDNPAFSTDPAILRQAAQAVKPGKHSEATVLLNELQFKFDENGKMLEIHHLIYRIENQDGVKDWAETSGRWEDSNSQTPFSLVCVEKYFLRIRGRQQRIQMTNTGRTNGHCGGS